jgi:hypothetical protein
LSIIVGCATTEPPPPPRVVDATPPSTVVVDATTPKELGFDPSPLDKPSLGHTGFDGVAAAPADSGYAKGLRIHGVKPGSGLEAAGLKAGDLIVKFDGVVFAAVDDDPIGTLRNRLLELPFDSDVQIAYWREKEGVREATVRLGRQPPPFASMDTPADWLAGGFADPAVAKLIADAVALDHGEARYADVVARNKKHLSKTDALRLRETTIAHLDLAANEPLARAITDAVAKKPATAARVAAGGGAKSYVDDGKLFDGLDVKTLDGVADAAARLVVDLDAKMRAALGAWTAEDREFVAKQFHLLSERVNEGEYLFDDEKPARERVNRRLVKLFAVVDRARIAAAAEEATTRLASLVPKIALAADDGREGLLVSRDTPAGRVEIWGRGNTRHANRCAFCFDFAGDDDWLDCAGRADLDHPVSITVDWSGDDVYSGTSDFNEGGALGGIGILIDREGDDQYVARSWSQGCGVAGFGLLVDHAGRDVYHGQSECQGVGLAGAGVLEDDAGDDLYTGARFCQGVGFAGGVGALIEKSGDDRYVCTGRFDSEYGEPGLFSGWGQGVGYGFRGIASGGIGILFDQSGRDVYEAGNFSQGGGYFYAWGILRDDKGDDRYVGSRYAQGFAAHQAVGTFLEGAGNDLYQSHSDVADGLAWDESSVVFHDLGGDDRYETGGFSLASAAHNGMVLFMDDAGDDRYADSPAHAASNEYHGGKSFALFVDKGGKDVYGAEKLGESNNRVFFRDDGAYFIDLPPEPKPMKDYVR